MNVVYLFRKESVLFILVNMSLGLVIAQHTHPPPRLDPGSPAFATDLLEIFQQARSDASRKTEAPTYFIRCLTPYIMMYNNYKDLIPSQIQRSIDDLIYVSASLHPNSYISPSGLFIIHYSTTGISAVSNLDRNSNNVPDYVELVGQAADSSYQVSVIHLGHKDPLIKGEPYSITLEVINPLYYGLTTPTDNSTEIFVRNRYIGFPPNDSPLGNEIGSMQVTVAHEFKHAIQYKANEWKGNSEEWAEMDATLMEEVVYDEVNDYYNAFNSESNDPTIFNDPSISMPGSYEQVSHMLFFEERLGSSFWVDVWEEIGDDPSISMVSAMKNILQDRNLTFRNLFAEDFSWHYMAGSRIENYNFSGFDEASAYPLMESDNEPITTTDYILDSKQSNHLSADLYEHRVTTGGGDSPLYRLSTSSASKKDITLVAISLLENGQTEVHYIQPNIGDYIIPNKWEDIDHMALLVVNYNESERITYSLETSLHQELLTISQNFPNPFRTSTNIQVEVLSPQTIDIELFDILGRRVFHVVENQLLSGSEIYQISSDNLSSGVYFYRLSNDEGFHITRMMTILR